MMFKDLRNLFVLIFLSVYGVNVIKIADRIANLKK